MTLLTSEGGETSLRLADNHNIDLIRQTYTSYELIDLQTHRFCMVVRIETNKDMVTTMKGKHCRLLEDITEEERRWMRLTCDNFQYIGSN